MSAYRDYRIDNTSAARRNRRHHIRINDHRVACLVRRDRDRRERKHRARWYEAIA